MKIGDIYVHISKNKFIEIVSISNYSMSANLFTYRSSQRNEPGRFMFKDFLRREYRKVGRV